MRNLSAYSNNSYKQILAFATETTTANQIPGSSLYDHSSPDNNIRGPTDKLSRLLIVDDDDVDRERIHRYINKFKIPVITLDASNGAEALQTILEDKVDLVLLDYQLGDMTGAEVLGELQKHNKSPIPTVMITGMGDESTAIEAMRLGVLDYLPKQNLTAESLMLVISSALLSVHLEKHLRETQDNLRRMSLYDSLTGLPNRNLFFDRLNHAILSGNRNKGAFSILMIDLNLFKEVNDNLGHKAGDKVLEVIGDRLQAITRKSDTLARIGGDEFACISHNAETTDNAISCAEKILHAITQPIAVSERIIEIGASIGIVRYPDHGQDQTTLLSNADCAMYRAKRAHRSYEIYNETDDKPTSRKVPVSHFLYRGIKRNELFLEYQPKINLNTRETIGAEVLVRWNSPELGLVMPDDFIPTAERSSLIEDVTYATIEMAVEQLLKWRKSGQVIPLALNISARMLDNKKLAVWLINKIKTHNIDPQSITLEITETTLTSSSKLAYQILHELDEAGFELSIDDFGSGFTSFSSIRNVAISEIKIDQLYISKIQIDSKDAAIVRSMLVLADSLGMRVVAEGVETEQQWNILQKLGCEYAQGFGIARSMTADSLVSWIKTFSGNNKP